MRILNMETRFGPDDNKPSNYCICFCFNIYLCIYIYLYNFNVRLKHV